MASEDVELDGIHGESILHVHANEPNGMWHAGTGADSQASFYTCMYILFSLGVLWRICVHIHVY